jgi:hypothetical protein
MNDATSSIEKLIESAEEYGKTTVEIVKLDIISKTSETISSLATRLVILAVVALFVFIINIGLSLWVGELLGRMCYGFFTIAAFYLLVALILYASRNKWIKHPIQNSIIAQMLKTN